jgi:hypothetical protein
VRTGLNSGMADVDQENIDSGLGGPNHILGRCNKLDDRVVKFGPCPPVARLVASLVPVEQLRNFVGHVAHAASPSVDMSNSAPYILKVRKTPTDSHHQ